MISGAKGSRARGCEARSQDRCADPGTRAQSKCARADAGSRHSAIGSMFAPRDQDGTRVKFHFLCSSSTCPCCLPGNPRYYPHLKAFIARRKPCAQEKVIEVPQVQVVEKIIEAGGGGRRGGGGLGASCGADRSQSHSNLPLWAKLVSPRSRRHRRAHGYLDLSCCSDLCRLKRADVCRCWSCYAPLFGCISAPGKHCQVHEVVKHVPKLHVQEVVRHVPKARMTVSCCVKQQSYARDLKPAGLSAIGLVQVDVQVP